MQTFLPYESYEDSAKVLDMRRLGKQRVEVLQLLQGLAGLRKNGWINHPCSKMWKGYESSLIYYGIVICNEWLSRGYKDTCREKIMIFADIFKPTNPPTWLGSEPFHLSHKSNLIRKNPEHYNKYFNNVRNDIPYIWPI